MEKANVVCRILCSLLLRHEFPRTKDAEDITLKRQEARIKDYEIEGLRYNEL
jgi:hypothetical protein